MATPPAGIELLATGIPGFDLIARGGLPLNRSTLVSGAAGTGKTVFATQFLVAGIQAGEACVFVTLEESPEDLRADMRSLEFDIAGFEAAGQWLFVDGSALPAEDALLVGDYDLGGLLVRIQAAVAKVGARRVVIDAVSAVAIRFSDPAKVRQELLHITRSIRALGVTVVLTGERPADRPQEVDSSVAEFVVDNLVILRQQRIVLDTLTALKRIASEHTFREFTLNLISYLKQTRLTAFMTADIDPIFGANEATGQHLSTITDTIVLLRYIEVGSRMRRGLTVLKSRGSAHDTEIREYTIDDHGLHIGTAFPQTRQVLGGRAFGAGMIRNEFGGGKPR